MWDDRSSNQRNWVYFTACWEGILSFEGVIDKRSEQSDYFLARGRKMLDKPAQKWWHSGVVNIIVPWFTVSCCVSPLTCGARAPVHPKQLHNFHLAAPAAPHTADIPNQVPTSLKLEKCQKDHLFSLPMWKRMLWIKQHCTLGHCISLMPFESGQSIRFFLC